MLISDSEKKRCFVDQADFQGSDISGNPREGFATSEACIKACKAHGECKGLVYKADTNECWFKSVHFTLQTDVYVTGSQDVTGSLNMECLFGKFVGKVMLTHGIKQFHSNFNHIHDILKNCKLYARTP